MAKDLVVLLHGRVIRANWLTPKAELAGEPEDTNRDRGTA